MTLYWTTLDDTNNRNTIEKILNATSPEKVKVCGKIYYNITCDEDCCSNTEYELIWTIVDPGTLSGAFLYQFAHLNWKIFGFEWEGACDLNVSVFVLTIDLTRLPDFCYNDTEIWASLSRLTTQVTSYTHLAP